MNSEALAALGAIVVAIIGAIGGIIGKQKLDEHRARVGQTWQPKVGLCDTDRALLVGIRDALKEMATGFTLLQGSTTNYQATMTANNAALLVNIKELAQAIMNLQLQMAKVEVLSERAR